MGTSQALIIDLKHDQTTRRERITRERKKRLLALQGATGLGNIIIGFKQGAWNRRSLTFFCQYRRLSRLLFLSNTSGRVWNICQAQLFVRHNPSLTVYQKNLKITTRCHFMQGRRIYGYASHLTSLVLALDA